MRSRALPLLVLMIASCTPQSEADPAAAQTQVMQAERAFARTMADRDLNAFRGHLSADAIFFAGEQAIRGPDAVVAEWSPYFNGPDAPFSWDPDQVQVLDSGGLALSTGPVFDPDGQRIGRFNSVWRLEEDGVWRVVFDKGSPICECDGQDAA